MIDDCAKKRVVDFVVLLVAGLLASGCSTCGGISLKESEEWLSFFMKRDLAHAVCYHEKVSEDVLVSGVDKWYVYDDVRYLILSHPDFPKRKRIEHIEKHGVDDFYFGNALRSKLADGEDCRAYLRYLDDSWFSMSECLPLKDILMLMEAETDDFYRDVWLMYKLKRERFPFWGFLPMFNKLDFVRVAGIEACGAELFDIAIANKWLPDDVRCEIAEQLNSIDYRGECMRAMANSNDPEWWERRISKVEEFFHEFSSRKSCHADGYIRGADIQKSHLENASIRGYREK